MDDIPTTSYSFCEITCNGLDDLSLSRSELDRLIDLALGQKLSDRYVLLNQLGAGAMGQVYLAYDPVLERNVALKVTNGSSVSRSQGLPGVLEEGQMAAQVNHPSIASVYDTGVHQGRPYTIFEFIDGLNLRETMKDRPRCWPVEDVAALLRMLADALDFAHSRGVIHCDLKPENIALGPNGVPKILDFGIATRLTANAPPDRIKCTPAYASPEQVRRNLLDGRSDQYALGLIVYELLCGRGPFIERDPVRMLCAQGFQQPPSIARFREDLSPEIVKTVMRALEKAPQDRYATCREFAASFEAGVAGKRDGSTFEQRTDVHITETQSDSLVTRALAGALESKGFRAWYYQRDALPGIPLSRQARDSLRATKVALLLISRNSLGSKAFEEEVMMASELGRPFLPMLVDMSLDEFSARPPIWRPALGAAAIIEYRRNDQDNILQRLCQSLELLGVDPGPPQRKAPETKKPSAAQVWATDSNQIDNRDLQRIVFRNPLIDDYLTRPNKYFLSATKGLGKTLLMKYKRRLLTQDASMQGSVCLIPSGQPYLDFMSEMSLLSKHYEKQLSISPFAKDFGGFR